MKFGFFLSLIIHGILFLALAWQYHAQLLNEDESIELSLANISEEGLGDKNQGRQKATKMSKNKPKADVLLKSGSIKKGGRASYKGGGVTTAESYTRKLQSYIESYRHYPRRALALKQEGIVRLSLKVNKSGLFEQVQVIEKTDHDILNKAAKQLVDELQRFEPLPETYQGSGEFVVPIHYQLD